MKKALHLILCILFFAAISFSAQAQCTPDPSVTDPEGNGEMVPDTIEAYVNQALNLTLTILAPLTADVGAGTINIHHITVKSLNNKPTWLSYACNPSSCEFPAGVAKCVLTTGTPPAGSEGYFAVTVLVDVYATILGNPVLVASDYDSGMPLIVHVNPPQNVEEYGADGFGIIPSTPNPFNGTTSIGCFSSASRQVSLKVYNMMGQQVYSETMQAAQGENYFRFDGSSLGNGTYFYTITDDRNQSVTRKLVKSN